MQRPGSGVCLGVELLPHSLCRCPPLQVMPRLLSRLSAHSRSHQQWEESLLHILANTGHSSPGLPTFANLESVPDTLLWFARALPWVEPLLLCLFTIWVSFLWRHQCGAHFSLRFPLIVLWTPFWPQAYSFAHEHPQPVGRKAQQRDGHTCPLLLMEGRSQAWQLQGWWRALTAEIWSYHGFCLSVSPAAHTTQEAPRLTVRKVAGLWIRPRSTS